MKIRLRKNYEEPFSHSGLFLHQDDKYVLFISPYIHFSFIQYIGASKKQEKKNELELSKCKSYENDAVFILWD